MENGNFLPLYIYLINNILCSGIRIGYWVSSSDFMNYTYLLNKECG